MDQGLLNAKQVEKVKQNYKTELKKCDNLSKTIEKITKEQDQPKSYFN